MRPVAVVVIDPATDAAPSLGAGFECVQIDALVLQGSPEPLDEPIVNPAASSVHGDFDLCIFQLRGEVEAGELRALIGVEDLRRGVAGHRLVEGFQAEPDIRSPLSLGPMARQGSLFDSRHANTFRVALAIVLGPMADKGSPMIATR